MRLFLLWQQLVLLAIAGQVQSHVSPRTFKFRGEKEGQIGGCNAADVEIILEEIEMAKKAAEFAAEQLTKYPFFQAFQEPKAFGKKELENAGKEVFTRIAAMLDGFHKDDGFTIECRNERCTENDADTVAIMSTKKDGTLDPILSLCQKFFETDSSTQKKLEQYKKAMDCYRMARGYHDVFTKILKSPERVRGARKAAENAESWALIASGMYMSKQLRIKQIPIQGIADWMWEDTRIGAQ
ncbi:hypothetical protein CH35J_003704 [Colletotrichum higginsianum]|uniref:Uncharacterized protein n=1 Tax=Colletotrichum higginsianum TaxID=80884 RepID=A0A4T0W9F3_9PEZI|nr:hypothetical protein CH35J_003704 [Colletotrichum higginsianum]